MRKRRGSLAVCVLVGACAARGPSFRHDAEGWATDGSRFHILAAAGGQGMPATWTLDNYVEEDGVLRRRWKDSPDLVYHREDRSLIASTEPLESEDVGRPLAAIAKKSLATFRQPSGTSRVMVIAPDERYQYFSRWSGKPTDAPVTEITRPAVPELRTVTPPAVLPISGAEAIEATFDQVFPGAQTRRIYAVWMRPGSDPSLTMLVYAAAPDSFDEGLADAKHLARRFVFR